MKALWSWLGAVFFALALVGCGKTDQQKAQENVDNVNQRVPRLETLRLALRDKGLFIDSVQAKTPPDAMSDDTLNEARAQLTEFIKIGNEVINYSSQPNVYYAGQEDVRLMVQNCRNYLDKLKGYEQRRDSRRATR